MYEEVAFYFFIFIFTLEIHTQNPQNSSQGGIRNYVLCEFMCKEGIRSTYSRGSIDDESCVEYSKRKVSS